MDTSFLENVVEFNKCIFDAVRFNSEDMVFTKATLWPPSKWSDVRFAIMNEESSVTDIDDALIVGFIEELIDGADVGQADG